VSALPERTWRFWHVPGQERTCQRIDVVKYPEWPELAAVPVVETWTPWSRLYETLNLSGDVVVSVKDSMGRELTPLHGPCAVTLLAESTSPWSTRR
jgi:hypothetical protein